jgi:competence protein ComEA
MKKRAVNINRASTWALEKLPLIGPKRAGRIISYRKAHGPFRSIEELDFVPGIGERIVAKIRPYITV